MSAPRISLSQDDLLDAVVEVASCFEPGELPYLSLTSMPESAIRDRLAWVLYQERFRVTREWRGVRAPGKPAGKREPCDLAILHENGEPTAVIELKATFTHNVQWGWSDRRRLLQERHGGETALEAVLRNDADKAVRLSGQGSGYLLAIAVHREDKIPRELDSVIKVGRRRVAELRHAEEVVTSYLSPLGPVTRGVELARGKAFGIRAVVEAWLCGPIASRDTWGPPAAGPTSAGAAGER